MIVHSKRHGTHEVIYDTDIPELVALVESFVWGLARNGRGNSRLYAVSHTTTSRKGRSGLFMHRLMLVSSCSIDHINGNGLDNRLCNLRACTTSQNGANRGLTRVNTSGHKGVTWHRRIRKWQAQIEVEGRSIYLGVFSSIIDAAAAYGMAAKRHFGDFAQN